MSSIDQRPPRFVVLTGMHTSGKTTASRLLSSIGYLAHGEIGWAHRQAILDARDGELLVGQELDGFDRTILGCELLRDEFISSARSLRHSVESWHIGNLAYAAVRSPDVVPALEAAFFDRSLQMKPLVIHLTVNRSNFLARASLPDLPPPELYEFYRHVDDQISGYLSRCDVPSHLLPNDGSISDLERRLLTIVYSHSPEGDRN